MTPDSPAHEALLQFLYRAPIGLLQTSAAGEIAMLNPMAARLLMPLAPAGEMANLFALLAPLAPGLRALAEAQPAPASVVCEGLRLALAAPGQPAQTLALDLSRLEDGSLMGCLSDITLAVREEQRLAAQLRDAGRIDALTQLPTREVVCERIERALASRRADSGDGFVVLVINVDRFNHINVSHGAGVGDRLLCEVAERLNATVRPGDAVGRALPPASTASTAARLGGDEFVMLLEGLRGGAAEAQRIARRVVEALSRPYAVDGHLLHLGVSVGLVAGDSLAADADTVLQDAGIAMREAKRAGGARHLLFSPPMKLRATHRGAIEAELRRALSGGELFVVYQPIVELGTGTGTGVEALVRWRHPLRGTVPPTGFIEVAEQTGLIGALGAFVLQTACRQFMRWRAQLGAAAPCRVSVNLSRAQLAEPALVAQVAQALYDCGMPAAALQLEVTESLAAQDDTVRARLHELKAMGLGLALDDFGTGYSSLSSLHQLPVDVVKIDRSFVSQLESSDHHRVLVEATVRVAQSLGMQTVAEGVETEGQARALRALQCDKGQGYWFGRPMEAAALVDWLRALDGGLQRPA